MQLQVKVDKRTSMTDTWFIFNHGFKWCKAHKRYEKRLPQFFDREAAETHFKGSLPTTKIEITVTK